MAKIKKIVAREVLDSRGIPTIEGRLTIDNDTVVYAQAVAGESKGKFEAKELRDGNPERYNGKGVLRAIQYINELLGPKLIGVDVLKHFEVDEWLTKADGTPDYSKLGVNTTMVISQLLLKAAAKSTGSLLYQYVNSTYNAVFKQNVSIERIPSPIFNMMNGGRHGVKNLDFQEFHIIPATTTPYFMALELAVSLFDNLRHILKKRNITTSVSEEGGYTPNLFNNTEAFEVIKEGLLAKHLKLGVDIFTGIDCAASFYYKDGKYFIREAPSGFKQDDYITFLAELADKYNILILEDPMYEQDSDGWQKLNEKIGRQTYLVGDDYTAGNQKRLEQALKKNACNAVVLKFNQVGTLYQIFQIASLVKRGQLKLVFSHRLGESIDSIIADIAVGLQADFIKFGSPSRGERVSKYNRLLEIEQFIGTTT